jgi:FMN phosphatase YigB (HAD superfamily)
MPEVRYLLWDFGDTLVDQRWMWPSPEGVPGWTARWHALAESDLETRWNVGEATIEDVAAAFAPDLGCKPDVLVAHMEQRCGDVQFFEQAWAAARAHTLPQAIVTVNPDVFSRFVVPKYELESVFDLIVTSWEERTVEKARLCEAALERLGGSDPREALLIDNIAENVDAWRALGGQAYLFVGDEQFAADVDRLLPAEDS